MITFYRDGFTLSTNEKELRKYDDPKNKKFLDQIYNERIPDELIG